VAAAMAGAKLGPRSRRVVIKTRLIRLMSTSRAVQTHLRYIEREGVGRSGERGRAYGANTEEADLTAFEKSGRQDRHQFRLIVAPEDAEELEELKSFTRSLMTQMEKDLGSRLEWVAVDHWDTDNPHTHVVVRGVDSQGKDLVINGNYIAHGMRKRACELATDWLGPRTERELQASRFKEINQERWTGLDRTLAQVAQTLRGPVDGNERAGDLIVPIKALASNPQRNELVGRLQRLAEMGLAAKGTPASWRLRPDLEPTLRAMGERGDIIRTMQKALGQQMREMRIVNARAETQAPVIGQVIGKGLADELSGRGYLVVDGIDGRAHYVPVPERQELGDFPKGGIVEVRTTAKARQSDQTIARLAEGGIYKESVHRAQARTDKRHRDPESFVDAHIRRLEALRRAGIV